MILVLTYNAVHQSSPQYISELLSPYQPNRHLRSCDQGLLSIPRARLKYYGVWRFSQCAPVLLNRLPPVIQQSDTHEIFKRKLKTHLFKFAYSC